jgi:hypothetical protein
MYYLNTRNPIICSIWEQNIATPFIWKY